MFGLSIITYIVRNFLDIFSSDFQEHDLLRSVLKIVFKKQSFKTKECLQPPADFVYLCSSIKVDDNLN